MATVERSTRAKGKVSETVKKKKTFSHRSILRYHTHVRVGGLQRVWLPADLFPPTRPRSDKAKAAALRVSEPFICVLVAEENQLQKIVVPQAP